MSERGKRSPWGTIQVSVPIIPGMWHVSTAGHGGIKCNRECNRAIPESMRHEGGWYEEDCDWAIPFAVFSTEIIRDGEPHSVKGALQAKECLLTWNPAAFIELFPGETCNRSNSVALERDYQKQRAIDALAEGKPVRCAAVNTDNGQVKVWFRRAASRDLIGYMAPEIYHAIPYGTTATVGDYREYGEVSLLEESL